jgi:hypothetical protein
MDASLLTKRFDVPPSSAFELDLGRTPVPEPAPIPAGTPINDPNAFQVAPGPAGARALLPSQPSPSPRPPVTPAAMMGTPPAAPPPVDEKGSDGMLAFRRKINQSARAYRSAVDARRAQRKDKSGYEKLQTQLETSAGHLADLNAMEKKYPDVYGPDTPALQSLQREQMRHAEKLSRVRQELTKQAQVLSKKHGWKIGKDGGLEGLERIQDQSDREFDDNVVRPGFLDAAVMDPNEP